MPHINECVPFVPGQRAVIRRFRSEEQREAARIDAGTALFHLSHDLAEEFGETNAALPVEMGVIRCTPWAQVPLLENRTGSIHVVQYTEPKGRQVISCVISLPEGEKRKLFEVCKGGKPKNHRGEEATVNEILLFQQIVAYAKEDYAYQREPWSKAQ